ncbi:MAG: DUF1592 domain-containing protein [Planctomycetaceae bacterium]|nr:DUF1592 domain-containing protein [Planctomycetaceae bacterium]
MAVLSGLHETGRADDAVNADLDAAFQQHVQPVVQKYCLHCHNAETMESGIRVDQLSSRPDDRQLFLWESIREQIADRLMPPEDEPQPTDEERARIAEWIPRAMTAAAARNTQYNGSVRRLTVAQYRNTLRELLGLRENLTESLPPDGVTKDGFSNQSLMLGLSPLQVEAYLDIAQQALDLCIVDEDVRPVVQNFRVDLGLAINPQPSPDALVLGALSELLKNEDFVVTELTPDKPFEFEPFRMRTKYEFIEGYVGNDTIREWRSFDSIYHSVFACVRGTPGYPLGDPHQSAPEGFLLRPAIPSSEIFNVSNTYGPMANFKISLRELPHAGDFRVTVAAARYDDGMMLDATVPVRPTMEGTSTSVDLASSPSGAVTLSEAGIYQIDLDWTAGDSPGGLTLALAGRHFSGKLLESPPAPSNAEVDGKHSAFIVLRLSAGEHAFSAQCRDVSRLKRITLHRLNEADELAKRFMAFEQRTPQLGVHVGLRRDCGSTLARVGVPQPVTSHELQTFTFEGSINDYPSPDVEPDNVNYLAGLREIGVRSEYTDGQDMPRLLIRTIEFEGPYYDTWPPETHRRIFIDSANQNDHAAYAREIIADFATRAYRRPVAADELESIVAVWRQSQAEGRDFRQSIKDALLVVLTSPQFLMLIEESRGPQPELLAEYELASKLSYFLWNEPPDALLLSLASEHRLHESLDAELDRMIRDERFSQFMHEFASQWLSLDKLDVVSVDMAKFPKLTRDVKVELRQEPVAFLLYLVQQNLSARHLVESDLVIANDIVANYYGLSDHAPSGFEFVPHRSTNHRIGGLLTQAGILAGLSDGREANPVKRGAWLARKIIAEPPDDPPPNVPKLPEDDGAHLTLAQKLERHRNQQGCVKCHAGIDPWGLPFEEYDAAGRFRTEAEIHSESTLPDGTGIADVAALQRYLANERIDAVAFSLAKHLSIYAAGRSLSYHELDQLRNTTLEFRSGDYRMQDLLRSVIHSDLFLKK